MKLRAKAKNVSTAAGKEAPFAQRVRVSTEGGLTPAEMAFVREYMVDRNATNAIRRMKPDSKNPGQYSQSMLRQSRVLAEIDRLELEHAADAKRRAGLNLQMVLDELKAIAFGNVEDITSYDPKTKRRHVDWEKLEALPPEQKRARLAALQEVSTTERVLSMDGDNVVLQVHTKVKSWDKVNALVQLGRHMGMKAGDIGIANAGGDPFLVASTPLPADPVQAAQAYKKLIEGLG